MRASRQLQQSLAGLRRAVTSQPSKPLTSISRSLYSQSTKSPLPQRQPLPSRSPISVRYNSAKARTPSPLTDAQPISEQEKADLEARRKNEEAYQITFTCRACNTRSSHRMTKHGYHKGTVLINCPGCDNRHVISDHLKVFMDKSTTLEDILKEKGQTMLKGKLEGDVEFWEDGTVKASDQPSTPAQLGSGDQEKPSS